MSNPGASLRWGRIFVTAVGMVLIASAIGVLLAQNEKDVKRPAGWSETTHGKVHPDYKRLFAMDKVHEIHIAIQPEQYRVMQEDLAQIGPGGMGRGLPPLGRGADGPRGGRGGRGAFRMSATDPIYVPVTVTYDGHEWTRVGMRYKGNSSLMGGRGGKLPFRLEFAQYEKEFPAVKDQRFYGFEKLTFSSNMSDDSQLREVLATEVLRDRGVAAARAAFYRVMVDPGTGPEYWGLYSMIEDPADGAMLDAQFGSHHGNLYKPEGPGADWTYFDKEGFSKKNNKKEAEFKDVESAIAALNARANNPRAWRSALEARFDVDMFLRWLAVNTVINSWDAYGAMPHNYYLYSDPKKDGRLVWIPWDHNMSFGSGPGGARGLPGRGGGRGGPEGPAGPGFFPPDLPGGGPFPPGADPGRGFGPPPGGRGFPRGGQGAPGNGVPPFGPEGFPGDAFPGGRGFPPFGGSSGDVLHRQVGDQWPLIQRLMQDEVYSARYRELLVYAMVGLASPAAFEKRVRELHAMIASAVVGPRGETTSHTLSSPEAFERSLNSPDGPIQQLQSREEAIRTALAEVTRR